MHSTVQNLIFIKKQIESKLKHLKKNKTPEIIAVSKTFSIENILPLIDFGHIHFGENKVQESLEKWSSIKSKYKDIQLHMIGRLQRNKVKSAVKIFDFIHSVDSIKLAKKIADESLNIKKKIKIFIQINVGNEIQKSGIEINDLKDLFSYCKEINLEVAGFMCIPPFNENPEKYFSKIKDLSEEFNLKELSMGMSSDYLTAIEYSASYLRIGSSIFGSRD